MTESHEQTLPPVPGHWAWVGEEWESTHRDAVMAVIAGQRPEAITPFVVGPAGCGTRYYAENLMDPALDPDEWVVCMQQWDDCNHEVSPVVAEWVLDEALPPEVVQRRVRALRASYIASLRRILKGA
jgi:hypothetical protein